MIRPVGGLYFVSIKTRGSSGSGPAIPSAGIARFAILSISASLRAPPIGVRPAPQFAITRTEVRNPAEIVRVLLLKVVILLLRVRPFNSSISGRRSYKCARCDLKVSFSSEFHLNPSAQDFLNLR